MDSCETSTMNDMFTMFVLSMLMSSLLVTPSIMAVSQASRMWQLFTDS